MIWVRMSISDIWQVADTNSDIPRTSGQTSDRLLPPVCAARSNRVFAVATYLRTGLFNDRNRSAHRDRAVVNRELTSFHFEISSVGGFLNLEDSQMLS